MLLLIAIIGINTLRVELNNSELFKNVEFGDDMECICGHLFEADRFKNGVASCCKTKPTNDYNNKNIISIYEKLIKTQYFRYYKVDLYLPCRFWNDDGVCTVKSCAVDMCPRDMLPPALQSEDGSKEDVVCSEGLDLGLDIINKSISEDRKYFLTREQQQDTRHIDLVDEGYDSPNGEYVDLVYNPERFTGYSGKSSRNIWSNIYGNNCFMNETTTCHAKKVFQRIISGLHTSINIHLISEFPFVKDGVTTWRFNRDMFEQRFYIIGNDKRGQDYIKNLYFLYCIINRAIIKAVPVWNNMEFYTGDSEHDVQTKSLVNSLVDAIYRSPSVFREENMFSKNNTESFHTQNQIRHRFLNISRIMDCVGCDKCRLWGKLQTHGIGVALKILFSDPKSIILKRMEIVALFNAAHRYSNSVEYLRMIEKLLKVPNSSNEL